MLFYTCYCASCLQAPNKEPRITGSTRSKKDNTLVIDLHCHALIPEVEQLVANRPEKLAEKENAIKTLGAESAKYNVNTMGPAVYPKLVDENQRLHDMSAMGVNIQVISPAPTQYYYWADQELARKIIDVQNTEIAALCNRHPERLMGLGNVSLQHPSLAVEQLRYAIEELGLRGVEISSSVNGRELSDPSFDGFWNLANELECLVFLHPLGTSAFDRLNRYYLTNVIGQPLETTIALSHLIFSGLFDRCPNLKLIAAHGGGYLPSYVGRTDHAWHARPEAKTTKHPPSEYLKKIWFDTVVYNPESIRHLIDNVGVSQVVVGTDYPYDMGHYDIHGLLASVPDLSENDRKLILGENAAQLLKISVPSNT